MRAVQLTPGDLVIGAYVLQYPQLSYGILEIDPSTGDRTIISDVTQGSGPPFSPPTGISFAPDGSLLVTYDGNLMSGAGDLYRVDPVTGNRTYISTAALNTGPVSNYVGAQYVGNTILMSGGPIVSVDPSSGNRALVSGTGLGTGPAMASEGFAVAGTNLYVADATDGMILKVDTTTGDRTVVSSATVGTGPSLNAPGDVVIDAAGNLVVDTSGQTLLSINPLTGDRTLISGGGVGTGPSLASNPTQLAIASDGTIYANQILGGLSSDSPVLAIDPLTGNRTVVAVTGGPGAGPSFEPTFALAIVPAPEPSSLILAALAGLSLLAFRRLARAARIS